jgi:hypothetical protein
MRELMPGINHWPNVGIGSGLFYAIFSTLRESRRTPDPALPGVRSSLLRFVAVSFIKVEQNRRLGEECQPCPSEN